ncbi:ArsR/SmtB family transcription factor [Paenisporosarcina cavernae]|uniref:ArsR family transcriptional regulator n=1 Tax=Paenisporosarcina cavernae TaxID=2320858 RepID=A0A385YVA7_9BACL|nr:metalloregulator ArsR/SmtB family transcription factor [Paenisporosarcina cavernae]AYC30411.1 ArsR family transcriptional regulator [Paenisporosarcina cavernae]
MNYMQADQVLKALADTTRLKIVKYLSTSELCVCELTELLHMSQPAVSQHMKKLKDAGLVKERKQGRWTIWQLEEMHDEKAFILQLIHELPTPERTLEHLVAEGKKVSCTS